MTILHSSFGLKLPFRLQKSTHGDPLVITVTLKKKWMLPGDPGKHKQHNKQNERVAPSAC